MTSRRRRFERGARLSRREIEKAREERPSRDLTKARDALSELIDDLDTSDAHGVIDAIQGVDATLGRAYRQAETMVEDEI